MNETIKRKLTKLTAADSGIYQIDIETKCKTKDGMIYTLSISECYKADVPEGMSLAAATNSKAIEETLSAMNLCETERFIYSAVEARAINTGEITHIWANIGNVYTDNVPMASAD